MKLSSHSLAVHKSQENLRFTKTWVQISLKAFFINIQKEDRKSDSQRTRVIKKYISNCIRNIEKKEIIKMKIDYIYKIVL